MYNKKKLDTKREIKIKSQIRGVEFASQLPPAEPIDPELEERMMLQFTRSRLSVGSTHLQSALAERLRGAFNVKLPAPVSEPAAAEGPAPEGLEAERSFRLLAPNLQEHILSIVNANPEDTALVDQIRTLISDDLFRGLSLNLQSAFVDTLVWNAEADIAFMLNFMKGRCFQEFLADPNYTEEQKSFELSFIADLSVLAAANAESVLNDTNFRNLNGGTLNAIIEELNSHEGDRFLDTKFRHLINSIDFLDMRPDYQQSLIGLLSQHSMAKVADIVKFLNSSEFIKIYSNAEAVTNAFLNVLSKSDRETRESHGG
jgi:hypothetical protein